jgi:TolB-like protein/DNA-binding winged helix-turn-helix (wHTH) protein
MEEDFLLGEWIVRPQRRIIERDGQSVHIKPKPMSVLLCLVTANGAPVSRNELFDAVWPGGVVSDETLTKCIAELRKAFGDTARDSRVIETIPKLGFRLVVPAASLEEEPTVTQTSTAPKTIDTDHLRARRSPGLLVAIGALVFVSLLVIGISRLWQAGEEDAISSDTSTDRAAYPLEQTPGIAVLPFVNMSSDPENEYFSDGMSEEILNALANTNRLPVIARTSSFQFKNDNRDVKEIGRMLGVTHILEGSVRRADESVRVTAQLIDAITGMHLWSDVYQRDWSDIFVLQDELTRSIVDQVTDALGDKPVTLKENPPGADFMTMRRTENLEAYELYLKGMQMLASTNPKPIEESVRYFDQAIALDPEYADAWAGRGRAIYVLGRPSYGHSHIPAAVYPVAITAFTRALEIDPEHAFAMGWLGMALIHSEYRWTEGMQLLKRSLELNPNDAGLLSVYGSLMKTMQMEGADDVLNRAYRLDPFGIVPITLRAFGHAQDDRMLDALTVMETSLIGDRDGYAPNSYVAFFNTPLGRYDAVEKHYKKAREVAHPVDLNLDRGEWTIATLRDQRDFPWEEFWARGKTERLNWLVLTGATIGWKDQESMIRAYDLTIDQRHPELLPLFFGPAPPGMPEADWKRMQETTGVTRFMSSRR